jgi:hypothetical protein
MARKKNTEQKIENTIQPPINVENKVSEVSENILLVNKPKRGRKPKNQLLVNTPIINTSEVNTTINDKEQNMVFEISDVLSDKLEDDNVLVVLSQVKFGDCKIDVSALPINI